MANLMTTSNLARHLRCSRAKIVMMAESGMIPSIDVSIGCQPSYRFDVEKVMAALQTPMTERNQRDYDAERATFIV